MAHAPVARRGRRAFVTTRRGLGDRALDFLLAGFAGWTLVYHACVVARLGTTVALIAWAPLLAAAAFWTLRAQRGDQAGAAPAEPGLALPGMRVVQAAGVVLAAVCAALFAYAQQTRWLFVWALWIAAAACGLAAVLGRRSGDDGHRQRHGAWLERLATAAWMLALAGIALTLLDPDDDDTYYLHLSQWIAANGSFPLRDVVFGNLELPSLYWPPVASYDALVGSVSGLTTVGPLSLAYYVIAPAGAAAAVLALRRMLRSWQVALPVVALSVGLMFLLATAQANETYGAFSIGRLWQGKSLLLAVFVPVLFALLHDFGSRPSRDGAARLAAAGIAGVGLSTTGVFLIPTIAFGCMAVVALRSWRAALAGFAATVAYPVGAAVVTKAMGGRVPDVYVDADVVAPDLVHLVLNPKHLAVLAMAALLVAPALIPRALAARMVAATVLLVGLLYAPGVPLAIFHATDLGRVLWRLMWAIPVAGLVGALAVGLVRAQWPPLARLVPAGALLAYMLAVGLLPWEAKAPRGLEFPPVLKRFPDEVAAARTALRAAAPGDLVYAPRKVSQTILVLSPDVYTVNPRGFFTTALEDEPAALVPERKRLHFYTYAGVGPDNTVVADVDRLGVDVACMPRELDAILATLRDAGWQDTARGREVSCVTP
ncbi:MAG: DUF6077 domain-containing protein [Solirubrobacteraceae bacterium]